jgi:hypothetical protein
MALFTARLDRAPSIEVAPNRTYQTTVIVESMTGATVSTYWKSPMFDGDFFAIFGGPYSDEANPNP